MPPPRTGALGYGRGMLLPARLLAGSRSLVLLLLPVACAPEELPAAGDLGALEVVAGIVAPVLQEGLTGSGGPGLQDPLEVAPIQRPLRAPYTAEALAGEVQDLLTEVADRLLLLFFFEAQHLFQKLHSL